MTIHNPPRNITTSPDPKTGERVNSPTNSLIILLAGVPGVGKTTLGNALLGELGLTHHISTGFLRATMDLYLPDEQSALLRKRAFDAYELLNGGDDVSGERVLEGCVAQAELLKPVINACIGRARREGIGLVMEGSHFIPGVVDPKDLGADLLCVLDVPDREELKRRANSPNHLRRHLSAWDLERLIMLQDQLLAQARSYCAPVVVNVDLTDAVGQVRQAVEGLD